MSLTLFLFRKSSHISQVNADTHHIRAAYEPLADPGYLNETVSLPVWVASGCEGSVEWTAGNRVCRFQEKVSRLDRIVAEHNQFSLGVKELQDWMTDVVHMLDSYSHPTSDKSVLDSRMLKLEVCISETHL